MSVDSSHDRLAAQIPDVLAGLLGVRPADVTVSPASPDGPDVVLSAGGHTFVIEFKTSGSAGPISVAARQVQRQVEREPDRVLPLVAAPFMSDAGRGACEDAGVGWFDLSGNARIIAPGLRVIVDGKPNQFRSVGRPSNVFAPKSARVVRWLLIQDGQALTQRGIARATDMGEGFVSRIVRRLERDGYLARDEAGAVRAKDPSLLLDAWRDAYRFDKHELHAGHVAARSGDALLRFVADTFAAAGTKYAATGLAAAWAETRFAAFRIVTVYLPSAPSPALLDRLGYRSDPRGANLWLVVPNDAGVFHGAAEKDGIRCVHPVQTYVDLKGHPERAPEAAESLRQDRLNWSADA